MKSAATLERRLQSGSGRAGSKDSVLHFEEGLIGFSECKDFVLMENDELAPFRILQSIEEPEIGFLALDPLVVVKDYYSLVPQREWETVTLRKPSDYLAFVICVIGEKPSDSTGNLQAPLLINYKRMIGRQVILMDSAFSVRHPLL
jgi:flagellar assembly factor FliW